MYDARMCMQHSRIHFTENAQLDVRREKALPIYHSATSRVSLALMKPYSCFKRYFTTIFLFVCLTDFTPSECDVEGYVEPVPETRRIRRSVNYWNSVFRSLIQELMERVPNPTRLPWKVPQSFEDGFLRELPKQASAVRKEKANKAFDLWTWSRKLKPVVTG